MCGWTKKRGSMKAVVLMATPCPKSLHDKAEKWIAQRCAGPGLATADDCDDGEEVSRVRLRYPKHLMSCTIAPAHTSRLSRFRLGQEPNPTGSRYKVTVTSELTSTARQSSSKSQKNDEER